MPPIIWTPESTLTWRNKPNKELSDKFSVFHDCTEVRYVSFLSGGFITGIAVTNGDSRNLSRTIKIVWTKQFSAIPPQTGKTNLCGLYDFFFHVSCKISKFDMGFHALGGTLALINNWPYEKRAVQFLFLVRIKISWV